MGYFAPRGRLVLVSRLVGHFGRPGATFILSGQARALGALEVTFPLVRSQMTFLLNIVSSQGRE